MKFEVTQEQQDKINNWLKSQVYPKIIEEQKQSGRFNDNYYAKVDWSKGYPYQGAIGGGLAYKFTPTSLGLAFSVEAYGKELNLTNYDEW